MVGIIVIIIHRKKRTQRYSNISKHIKMKNKTVIVKRIMKKGKIGLWFVPTIVKLHKAIF